MQFKWMNESRLSESKDRLELYAPRAYRFLLQQRKRRRGRD